MFDAQIHSMSQVFLVQHALYFDSNQIKKIMAGSLNLKLKFYDIFLLCSIQYYVIKIVGDVWQLCDFLHRHHQWCLTLQEVHITTTCSNKLIFLHYYPLSKSNYYTPRNEVVGGYTGFTMSVRPSVCRQILCRTIT